MRSTRLFPSLTLAAVLAMTAVGCGGSSTSETGAGAGSTIAAASSNSETTATAVPTTAASTVTSKVGSGTTTLGSGGGAWCDKNRAALESSLGGDDTLTATVMGAMADPAANKEKLRKLFEESQARNDEIVRTAPSEIKTDLQLLLAATSGIADALKKADYDMSKIDLVSAMGKISSPEFSAASLRVNKYFKDACGIDLGNG